MTHTQTIIFALLGFFLLWTIVHIPGIVYGTQDTPLHVSYMTADEQSPVNGALHMLKEKSILGLKNQNTLYYGPVFSLFALPAVVVDYATHFLKGEVTGGESYKEYIVWDWGGVLAWARIIAVFVGAFGLLGVFHLFKTKACNPKGNEMYPYIATVFLACNFLFFEYSNFFRHWVFIVSFLIWQVYIAVRIFESEKSEYRLWIAQTLFAIISFGISYLGSVYLVFWVPFLVVWFVKKDWKKLKCFGLYVFGLVAGFALIVWWHPYAFIRYFGLLGLIEPIAMGAVLDMTPSAGKVHSFLFYARVVLINTFLLIPLGIVLAVKMAREKFWKRAHLWALLLPAVVNYILFSIPSEPESRYMLPTVVFVVLFVLALYVEAREILGRESFFIKVSSGMLVLTFIVGCVQIIGWQRIMFDGVPERREFGVLLQEWQMEKPETKILVIKGWPLGYVHTHDAYENYIARYNKSSYDLWQYILTLDPPKGVTPINVYYLHDDEVLTEEMFENYDHIVRHIPPQTGADVLPRAPYDEFDIRPWHMWDYKKYQESFEIIK